MGCDHSIKSFGQFPAKRKQASRSQTLARAPKLPDFAERLDCVKLASAFESERLSAICELGTARGPFQHMSFCFEGGRARWHLRMNR